MNSIANNVILKVIKERRSIRKYTGKDINNDLLKELLTAGMYAPSAVNKQPWYFVVIRDKALLTRITGFHPNASMIPGAALGILVCADENLAHEGGYWIQDCSAATQNILLAAHALGLGAVWLGIHPRESRKEGMRQLVGLPGHVQPFSLISVGYPAESKEPPVRFKPERVFLDHWGRTYEL